MASTSNISNEIWMNIFEQFYEEFPTRISKLRLVSHLFDALVVPIYYRRARLSKAWMDRQEKFEGIVKKQEAESMIHTTVTQRVAIYSNHVIFTDQQRGPSNRDIHIGELLNQCKKLQSVTWIYNNVANVSSDRVQSSLPLDLQEFLIVRPSIKLQIENFNYARESMIISLSSLNQNLTSFKLFSDGRYSIRELRLFLSQCSQLEELYLHINAYRRFLMYRGEVFPAVRRLVMNIPHWDFDPEDADQMFDFSALEEYSLTTSTPLNEVLLFFKNQQAPKLKALRYVSYTTPWEPPYSQIKLPGLLNDALYFLPNLQVLEIKCDINRVHLPGLLLRLPNLRDLDIGRHFAFQDKEVGYPMLVKEDIACLQKHDGLESLSVDVERDCCNTFDFLSSLCQIRTLRTLALRTQTTTHAEYTTAPNPLDQIAKRDGTDPDRCIAMLMARFIHTRKCHRLAEMKIMLGGYDEKLDWDARDVPACDGVLERRMFVASWNLWSTADEFIFEERRGRKFLDSVIISP